MPWPYEPCRVCGQLSVKLHRETDCIAHLKDRIDDLEKKLEALTEEIRNRQDDGE